MEPRTRAVGAPRWRDLRKAHVMTGLRVVSWGGGVQSTAMLVLAAQNRIPFRTFLFSNVGDDSENPDTLTYYRDTALPYAKAAGLDLIEVWRTLRNGDRETIYQRISRSDTKSVVIPIRGQNGKPMARDCTADFKVRVIGKWLKAHGATPENKATVAMGISVDEIHRANTLRAQDYEQLIYPLLDLR